MATITGSSLIRTDSGLNADSSDITRVYTDNGLTLDHSAGTATTNVANSSNFSNTFTESDPFHLNVNSIQQTSNNGLTLENGTIAYLHGPTTLPASDATIQNGGVNTFRNITWLAANGGTGTAWGWGIRGTGSGATGETTNCRFLSADGTIWFINLENANAAYIFANNELTDAALNIALSGAVVDGISFGDTARFQAQSGGTIGYTMRVQAADSRNSVLINNIFNGTTYNTGGNNVGRGQYQITYNAGSVTLINERHATDDIFISAFAGTRGSDIILNYAWNPQFRDGNDNSDIVDARLVNVTDTLTRRVPFTSSNTTLYGTLFPSIIEGETPMHSNSNGYIIQTINHTATYPHNQITNIGSRVLDLDGNLIATPKTYNVKSYTHDLPATVTTGTTGEPVSQITNAGGPNGAFGWADEDLTSGALDTNVLTNDTTANIATYNGSDASHITPRALYSRTKAVWYLNSLLENFGTTVNTNVSGEMAFQKPVTLTNTSGVVNVANNLVTIPVSNATGIVGDAFFNTISSTGDITSNVDFDNINLDAVNMSLSAVGSNSTLSVSGGSLEATWNGFNGISAAAGQIRVRAADGDILVHATDADGNDRTEYLNELSIGDTIEIDYIKGGTASSATATIVGPAPSVSSNVWTINATGLVNLNSSSDTATLNFENSIINFNDSNTGENLVLVSNVINGWSATANHENNLTINGKVEINLTNTSALINDTVTSISLFGSDDIAGTGNITLNSTDAITVQSDNPRIIAGNNVTKAALPEDVYTLTVRASSYPTAGFLAVKVTSAGGTEKLSTTIETTAGGSENVPLINTSYDTDDVVQIWYKPNNTTTVKYVTAYASANYGALSADTDRLITTANHPSLLVSNETTTAVAATPTVITKGTITTALSITISGATSRIDGGQTQSLYLPITDTRAYFDAIVNSDLAEDIIVPASTNSSQMDFRYITLGSTDGNQQLVTAIERHDVTDNSVETATATLTGGGTVNIVDIAANPLGATIPDITTGFNQSVPGQNINEMNRRTAWVIGDGTRTGHFKPNSNGDFNPDTAYEDNDANTGE